MARSGQHASVGRSAAAIHDLGYKRYLGSRRPQSSRWRVLVRNTVSTSWRGWWRMKAWVIVAALITVVFGALMHVRESDLFELMVRAGGGGLRWVEALLPFSTGLYAWCGFLLASATAAGAVARDLRAGAFEFYFSRPVRPFDYLLGKAIGSALVVGTAMFAGPVLLVLYRVGLAADDLDEVISSLALVPRMALVGAVGSLTIALVALAFSSLSSRPRITTAMWVGFYILFGQIFGLVALAIEVPDMAALSMPSALQGFAYGLFGVTLPTVSPPGLAASYASLLGHIAVALAVLHVRVKRAERAGLGGG